MVEYPSHFGRECQPGRCSENTATKICEKMSQQDIYITPAAAEGQLGRVMRASLRRCQQGLWKDAWQPLACPRSWRVPWGCQPTCPSAGAEGVLGSSVSISYSEISSCSCSKNQQETRVLGWYQIFSTEITILLTHLTGPGECQSCPPSAVEWLQWFLRKLNG